VNYEKNNDNYLSNYLNIDLCLEIMKTHKDFIVYDVMYFSVSKYIEEQKQKIEELEQEIKKLNFNYNDAIEDAEKYKSRCEKADEFIQKTPFINHITKLSVHNILQNGSDSQ